MTVYSAGLPYIGCFRDKGDHDLGDESEVINSKSMTNELCITKCRDMVIKTFILHYNHLKLSPCAKWEFSIMFQLIRLCKDQYNWYSLNARL